MESFWRYNAAFCVLSAFVLASCAARQTATSEPDANAAAQALLIELVSAPPPPSALACVLVLRDHGGTSPSLDVQTAINLLQMQGVAAVDGADCKLARPDPNAPDTVISWRKYGAF